MKKSRSIISATQKPFDNYAFMEKFRTFDSDRGRYTSSGTIYDSVSRVVHNSICVSPIVSFFYCDSIRSHEAMHLFIRAKYGTQDVFGCREESIILGYSYGDMMKGSFAYFRSDHCCIINILTSTSENSHCELSLLDTYYLIVYGCNLINNGHGPDVPLKIWIVSTLVYSNWTYLGGPETQIFVSGIFNNIDHYYQVGESIDSLDLSYASNRSFILDRKSSFVFVETNKDFVPLDYLSIFRYIVLRKFEFSLFFGFLPKEVCFYIICFINSLYDLKSKANNLFVRSNSLDDLTVSESKTALIKAGYGNVEFIFHKLYQDDQYCGGKPIFNHCYPLARAYSSKLTSIDDFKSYLSVNWPLYLEYYGDYLQMEFLRCKAMRDSKYIDSPVY